MSVYSEFLVLGSDGTIGAYAREDIVRVDLAQNANAGQPARQVYRLKPNSMNVTYEPAPEFAEHLEPFQVLCGTHAVKALVAMFPFDQPSSACAGCERERRRS